MKPTRPTLLVGIGAVTLAIGWGGASVLVAFGLGLPRVPVSAPTVLLLLAAIMFGLALSLRSRLKALRERKPEARPVNPLFVARAAVFAQATSPVGSLAAGLYAGYAIFLVLQSEIGDRLSTALMAALTAGAAILMVAAALFLERVCRLPPPRNEEGRQTGPGLPVAS